ncbi:MAG: NAD-dependent epimerase/dehydratase family protein [Saprospiraceae bacterium]
MRKDKILVIGANGQIGSVLTKALRAAFGNDAVVATDIRSSIEQAPFELLNILEADRLAEIIDRYKITQIYHLAAILSAKGESNPRGTWNINMEGLFNVLEVAIAKQIDKVFFPSSIAVFGTKSPSVATPQDTILNPTTVYGISKQAGELWCNYYFERYGLDVRSVRYPGIIGYESAPGGGTTDYAVEIYHEAIKHKQYECFLSANTELPMLYMPDAIRGTLQLMEAPEHQIRSRTSYNLAGMSFSPAEIAAEIQQFIPEFKISYKPDFRQKIADSWTKSIDDQEARKDWGWKPNYDLHSMTENMLENLYKEYKETV